MPGLIVKLYLSPPKKQDTKKADKDAKKSDITAIDKKDSTDKQAIDAKEKKSADGKDMQTTETKDKQTADSKLAGRPRVRMVLILEEASVAEPPADAPKKKKDG